MDASLIRETEPERARAVAAPSATAPRPRRALVAAAVL
ncbi:MAG: hypothetical protein JWP02_1834, partial [Acidimicrobiales bacterium]|nr:hypothetical protein [Acidimicrobiales bacterium]